MKKIVATMLALVMTLGMLPCISFADEYKNEEPYSFTLMGNLGVEMKEPDEKFFENIENALNLDIEVQLPPSTSYTESLQMMLASGEYPELVLFPNHTDTMFVDACRDGVILPLNDFLDDTPNLMKYSYDVSWKTLQILGDGKIFGVPRTSIARADGYMLRKDWLDKLGITYDETKPMTLEKFVEIARAFTFDDPDGNNINDTYGIGACCDDAGNITPLFGWAFGLIGWHEYDGEYMDLMYSRTHDNYKRALQFSADMWKEGLVDPDWPTVKSDIKIERFIKGVTGSYGEFAGWITEKQDLGRELNPDFSIGYITGLIENEGDPVQGGTFSTGFWGEWCLTTACEKPERVMQFLDYLLSDYCWDDVMYGPKGVTWDVDENGEAYALPALSDYVLGRAILRRNDAPGFFVKLNQSAEDRNRIEGLIDSCIKQAVFSEDEGFRPTIADDPTFIDYQKNMNVQISKIIIGDRPVDDWDEILDGWYKAGGETYIKEMQEYIIASKG